MKVYQWFGVFLMLFTIGCDCSINQRGRVFSNEDEEPIANVQIKLAGTDTVVRTDSLGYFDLQYVGGARCPAQVYIVTKPGYKSFQIELDQSPERTLATVKQDSRPYDLKGKNFYPDSMNKSTYIASIDFEKYSKDFAVRGDSLILYLDLDDPDLDFQKYVKGLKSARWILE